MSPRSDPRLSLVDAALLVLVTFVWGFNFVVIKVGLENFPPLLFSALRFLVCAFPAVFVLPKPSVRLHDLLSLGVVLGILLFAFRPANRVRAARRERFSARRAPTPRRFKYGNPAPTIFVTFVFFVVRLLTTKNTKGPAAPDEPKRLFSQLWPSRKIRNSAQKLSQFFNALDLERNS